MDSFNWTCPFCNRPTTISALNYHEKEFGIELASADGSKMMAVVSIACPNPDCRKLAITANLYQLEILNNPPRYRKGDHLKRWNLIPSGVAKPFPDYIPQQIREDYEQACEIHDLSPKASATLCRRCLQGMIRDFWKITKSRLKDEIDALEDQVDAETWQAIDAVREIGNIGAHTEKDVDLIIDVEPEEAQLLIELIETLFQNWYIERNEKQERNAALKELAEKKKAERKGGPTDPAAS